MTYKTVIDNFHFFDNTRIEIGAEISDNFPHLRLVFSSRVNAMSTVTFDSYDCSPEGIRALATALSDAAYWLEQAKVKS